MRAAAAAAEAWAAPAASACLRKDSAAWCWAVRASSEKPGIPNGGGTNWADAAVGWTLLLGELVAVRLGLGKLPPAASCFECSFLWAWTLLVSVQA